jgi:hypothetical protein
MPHLTISQTRSFPAPVDDADSFPPLGTAIKVLMIWPRFPPSFWGFQGMMTLLPEKTAMPPLGLTREQVENKIARTPA